MGSFSARSRQRSQIHRQQERTRAEKSHQIPPANIEGRGTVTGESAFFESRQRKARTRFARRHVAYLQELAEISTFLADFFAG
jgi:hypothetical protein